VKKVENGKLVISTSQGPLAHEVDCLIWAIGRDANVNIGIENTSLKLDEVGHIEADE